MSAFGDRWRPGWAVACVGLLTALGAYYGHYAQTVPVGYLKCLQDRAAYDQRELVFPLWEVERIDGPNRYEIAKVVRDVPVEGPTEGLEPGMTVSLHGRFRASDDVVVELSREIHHLRRIKEGLSFATALAAAVAVPWLFRRRAGVLVDRTEASGWPTS